MIAAENGALVGGKVGGIGDVIRDVPIALAKLGHQVSVITPGYQLLSRQNPAEQLTTVNVEFCGQPQELQLFVAGTGRDTFRSSVAPSSPGRRKRKNGSVSHYLLEHPLFASCGAGAIYCDDKRGPFATDAHKFSLFCAAVCELLSKDLLVDADVLHLHDWHAAMVAVLRYFHPAYNSLKSIPLVYSIHNLSLQGIRPLAHNESSLQSWFPHTEFSLDQIQDPRYLDCINLMLAGINLADRVHAVSPSYAKEILKASDPQRGFVGGEGLELDLQRLDTEGRIVGILNGCDYEYQAHQVSNCSQLLDLIEENLHTWTANSEFIPSANFFALSRITQWRKRRKPVAVTLTSIGRVTSQKARLLMEMLPSAEGSRSSALDCLLNDLTDGVFVMLGSGDAEYEKFFTQLMRRHDNFLFLRGFSEQLADALYGFGDLFLMPSSFEPCGISQMLAMRAGTPCIVHEVGGLRDTVQHEVNGFTFSGSTPQEQALAMIEAVKNARAVMQKPKQWAAIRKAALGTRFLWDTAVREYIARLYQR